MRRKQGESLLTTWTLSGAAAEFGMQSGQLKYKLRAIGIEPKRGLRYTASQIVQAMAGGSVNEEKLRLERAKAGYLELEMLEKEGKLAPMTEIEEMVRQWGLSIRQRLLSLPAALGARCNPSDAEHARMVLSDWVTDQLKGIQHDIADTVKAGPKRSGKPVRKPRRGKTKATVGVGAVVV